jgi:hypothetical protein
MRFVIFTEGSAMIQQLWEPKVYISEQLLAELKRLRFSVYHSADIEPERPLTHFMGYRIEVRLSMPFWSAKIRVESLDRFASYSPADLIWAEPLGLARWQGDWIHAISSDRKVISYESQWDLGETGVVTRT